MIALVQSKYAPIERGKVEVNKSILLYQVVVENVSPQFWSPRGSSIWVNRILKNDLT